MPTSPSKLLPISVNLPGANAVMGGIPLGSSVSPSSFATYDEPLTQTIHYTCDGKSITFEVVNKRRSLTELDSETEEVDPLPGNIFGRISKAIFHSCISLKTRRVKAKSLRTSGSA